MKQADDLGERIVKNWTISNMIQTYERSTSDYDKLFLLLNSRSFSHANRLYYWLLNRLRPRNR